nr:MAG TPA: hypothetical protein [Caudoviricetes sp.]
MCACFFYGCNGEISASSDGKTAKNGGSCNTNTTRMQHDRF